MEVPRSFDSLALAQDDRSWAGASLCEQKKQCHPEQAKRVEGSSHLVHIGSMFCA